MQKINIYFVAGYEEEEDRGYGRTGTEGPQEGGPGLHDRKGQYYEGQEADRRPGSRSFSAQECERVLSQASNSRSCKSS